MVYITGLRGCTQWDMLSMVVVPWCILWDHGTSHGTIGSMVHPMNSWSYELCIYIPVQAPLISNLQESQPANLKSSQPITVPAPSQET